MKFGILLGLFGLLTAQNTEINDLIIEMNNLIIKMNNLIIEFDAFKTPDTKGYEAGFQIDKLGRAFPVVRPPRSFGPNSKWPM